MPSLLPEPHLELANDYAGTRYLEFYPEKLPDIHGIVVGSAIYSIRDLGLPVLAVVPFAIGGRTGVLAMLCLVGALLAVQLYLLLRDLRFDRRAGFLAVGATAFVHPILTYTTQIYPDLIAALVYAPWVGGTGLFFDGPFGLIPHAAIYLLAFVGVVALWRRARDGHGPEIAALALPWALSFLYIASIAYWYADGGPASRYLLATMPFLVAAGAAGVAMHLALPRAPDTSSWVASAR